MAYRNDAIDAFDNDDVFIANSIEAFDDDTSI
jgi:hypothetical protein